MEKVLPKPPNKYSVNTFVKYYEHMTQGNHFNLVSVSKRSILTILKTTKVGAIFLSKPISDLRNLSITSEKFPDLVK